MVCGCYNGCTEQTCRNMVLEWAICVVRCVLRRQQTGANKATAEGSLSYDLGKQIIYAVCEGKSARAKGVK